jgi:hypothetical protein
LVVAAQVDPLELLEAVVELDNIFTIHHILFQLLADL